MTHILDHPKDARPPATGAAPGNRARPIASCVALICLAAYCSIGAAMIITASAKSLNNSWENTYTESPNIYLALEAARTGNLYVPFNKPPYIVQSYGPLYYAVNMAIAGASHMDMELLKIRARLLAYGCYLLCGLMAYAISRKLNFSTLSAALAALLLLAQAPSFTWNITVRPDMLCVLLMLLSLFFAEVGEGKGIRSYALAGVLGGLALLVKQTGFAVVLAVAAVLLLRKKFRETAWLGAGAALPVALVFGVLWLRHDPFPEQWMIVGKGLWSFSDGIQFVARHINRETMSVSLAAGAIGLFRAIQQGEGPQLVAAFAGVNTCVALLSLAQLGGDTNYFIPGLTGCALLLPFALSLVREKASAPWILGAVAAILVVAVWGEVGALRNQFRRLAYRSDLPFALLRPYRIFSDRPVLTLHGRDPDLFDPFFAHSLERAGYWDSRPIAEHVHGGEYDLVILGCMAPRRAICSWRGVAYYSAPVVEALNESYAVLCSAKHAWVLKPRARDVAATPELLSQVLGEPCGVEFRGDAPNYSFWPGSQ